MPEPDRTKGLELDVNADDVTLSSSHEKIKTGETNAQTYLDETVAWMDENNLLLADKTQATLLTPDPAEYNYELNLKIKGEPLETTKTPKILGLTFDPKLTFAEHVKKTEENSKKALRLVKALSGTSWGQQKETLVNTYKQYVRPIIEYASPAWSPIISDTNLLKLQRVQNEALRCATGHTRDTNIVHIHRETKVLPLKTHLHLVASQYRESARDPEHPMHEELAAPDPDRLMKRTALQTLNSTIVHSCDNNEDTEKQRKRNKQTIHTAIVQTHLADQPDHPLLQAQPPEISKEEMTLSRETRRRLAQLRARKCPLLQQYLHNLGGADDPSCPLCGHDPHDTPHIFECPRVPTELTPIHLWRSPAEVADLLERWKTALGAAEEAPEAAVRQ